MRQAKHPFPTWFAPVLFGVVLMLLWWALSALELIDSYALPSPQTVAKRLSQGLSEGYLTSSLLQTLQEAALGCLLAALVGIPLGLLIAHSRLVSRSVEPYLAASQAIPAVAIAPLLVIWCGYGLMPIVILCAIIVVFPIVINTTLGIRTIKRNIIEAARLDGASGMRLLVHIELPLGAPSIFAGLRTGFTLAMTGAVVGEMVIGGSKGLGIDLVTAQQISDSPGMFAAIVLLALVAVSIYLVLRACENHISALVSS